MKRICMAIVFALPLLLAVGCPRQVHKPGTHEDCGCDHELPADGPERAQALIERMVAKVGSMDDLKAHGDVEYTYTYGDPATGEVDVSTERYVFEGERSWARYETHRKALLPDRPGVIEQGYDGTSTWITLDGERLTDPQAVKIADFLRKTNFYWLTMMPKLLDPGLVYSHEGTRSVDGVDYEIVKVGFEDGVGDVNDTYVLYLNPETKLVDRFLFTVMDFGVESPHLMIVEYEELGCELLLPTRRRYAPATWEGELTEESWTHEISENVTFGNGFDAGLFAAPGA